MKDFYEVLTSPVAPVGSNSAVAFESRQIVNGVEARPVPWSTLGHDNPNSPGASSQLLGTADRPALSWMFLRMEPLPTALAVTYKRPYDNCMMSK